MREVLDWIVDNWRQAGQPVSGRYGEATAISFTERRCSGWPSTGDPRVFEGLNLEGRYKALARNQGYHSSRDNDQGVERPSSKLSSSRFEDDYLDAVNLMLPIMGFIDAEDPRMLSTIDATMKELVVNGLCYRYTEAPVGVAGKEATFTLCTFWLVSALILAGAGGGSWREPY